MNFHGNVAAFFVCSFRIPRVQMNSSMAFFHVCTVLSVLCTIVSVDAVCPDGTSLIGEASGSIHGAAMMMDTAPSRPVYTFTFLCRENLPAVVNVVKDNNSTWNTTFTGGMTTTTTAPAMTDHKEVPASFYLAKITKLQNDLKKERAKTKETEDDLKKECAKTKETEEWYKTRALVCVITIMYLVTLPCASLYVYKNMKEVRELGDKMQKERMKVYALKKFVRG